MFKSLQDLKNLTKHHEYSMGGDGNAPTRKGTPWGSPPETQEQKAAKNLRTSNIVGNTGNRVTVQTPFGQLNGSRYGVWHTQSGNYEHLVTDANGQQGHRWLTDSKGDI